MADLFFIVSKVFWALAQPSHFLLLLLILGLLLRRRLFGRLLVWGYLVFMVLMSIYPLGDFLLKPLEQRFPQPDMSHHEGSIAGIIILGGGEEAELSALYQRPEFGDGAERVMDIPKLLTLYPDVPVIFTGGSGSVTRPEYRGGDVAEQWFNESGLSRHVIIERESRNTHENALYTREVIHELDESKDAPWLLITSAFHMPRSVGVFNAVGVKVLAYPVDFKTVSFGFDPDLTTHMDNLETAVREWIGLSVYYLTGKTQAFLPALSDARESSIE